MPDDTDVEDHREDFDDHVGAPTEQFNLIVTTLDPDAVEIAAQARLESRNPGNPGYHEWVRLPAPTRLGLAGLMFIHDYLGRRMATGAGPSDVIDDVLNNLRAGAPIAVMVDRVDGSRLVMEPNRWDSGKAELALYTGRWDNADVYVVTDSVLAGLDVPPADRPAWWPRGRETLKAWCWRGEVQAAARERIEAAGGASYPKAICRELFGMRQEAGASGTPGSIEQVLRLRAG